MSNEPSATILVVDDDEDIVKLLEEIIPSIGDYRVLTALSGSKAISIIDSDHPDLVLLDIMMAGMDGTEVCRHIRSNENTSDILVIALTSIRKAEERFGDIMDSGVDDYMEKPFDFAELKNVIQWHLNNH